MTLVRRMRYIMRESTAQCISNCMLTEKPTHVLYREFGLRTIDDPMPPLRKDIMWQLATYYPAINLTDITIQTTTDDAALGQFKYQINVEV